MRLPRAHEADIVPGMRVLLRADFDVDVQEGTAEAPLRAKTVLPIIRFLQEKKARVRLLAHRGRPGGTRRRELSLASVADMLSGALQQQVPLIEDPFTDRSSAAYADIVLFENLRFWPGEEKNDPLFAASLASHGDIYINEAFAACHRSHASIAGLPARMPAFAGPHLMAEIEALDHVMQNPRRPLIAILGGVKIETKLPLLARLLRDADRVLIGGALANTIFAMRGGAIGKSVADLSVPAEASLFASDKLFLPSDVVVSDRLDAHAAHRICAMGDVAEGEYIADIGPASIASFASLLKDAGTVVWNGPMGYAEAEVFSKGTLALAETIKNLDAFTVVGGGDTVSALARHGYASAFSHVSTGGGAMLAFLAGERLPGLEALRHDMK